MAETSKKKRPFVDPDSQYDSDALIFIFQSRSPPPCFENSAVHDKEISAESRKAKKPSPMKDLDSIDF